MNTHKLCSKENRVQFILVVLTLTLALTNCTTERVIVVEKEKSPEEEYFETYKEIVADVGLGNEDYIGKRVKIRAEVSLFLKSPLPGDIVWLITNNENVSFSIVFFPEAKKSYREGLDYTFTVQINKIEKRERLLGQNVIYVIYAEAITDQVISEPYQMDCEELCMSYHHQYGIPSTVFRFTTVIELSEYLNEDGLSRQFIFSPIYNRYKNYTRDDPAELEAAHTVKGLWNGQEKFILKRNVLPSEIRATP